MTKVTSLGFALAIGAGLWGAACSSSSSSGTTGDDAGTSEDSAAADTSVADSAANDSAAADTSPDTAVDSAVDAAVDAGPICADEMSTGCEACLMTAQTQTCASQVSACESDDAGSSNPDAGSNLSCAGIVACIRGGGSDQTCLGEGTSTAQMDVEALAECVNTACPSMSQTGPIHIPLLPQIP
jgi:hypothetical protein